MSSNKTINNHPHRRDNLTSPSHVTLDRMGTTLPKTTSTTIAKRARRLSLTLDCTHLGLGERNDNVAPRKGFRDYAPATSEPGSLTDPNLFTPSESCHQVYSTGTVLQDAIAARVARVIFYFLLTSHKILLPDDVPTVIQDNTGNLTSGHGSAPTGRGPCLPSTPARLANIIQRMVSKNAKDRFLSMIQVRKELTIVRDQEREALKKETELV
ncbi:hypothetical protein BGZ94_003014, partial [Podila epigama]